jgi:hypothetical protein
MSQPTHVDPRGLRVVAGITAVVLALVLVLPDPANVALLAVQVAVFAVSGLVNLSASPYVLLYTSVVRPRLSSTAEPEDARPPRFAQLVGLGFTAVGLVAFLVGASTAGYVATGLALVAALLNAATGFCLGCEMYLGLRRLAPARP